MIKENNAITTNLVASFPTTEKNGVEVTIKGVLSTGSAIDKYRKALSYIHFFPNVYINDTYGGLYNASKYNETKKISYYDDFACINHRVDDRLLLGNVLYPLNINILSNNARAIVDRLQNTGIVLRFNIGELSITPNRENIIYTTDTIKKIESKIVAAFDKMMDIIRQNAGKNYTDCSEYYAYVSGYNIEYDFIGNKLQHKMFSEGLSISKGEFIKLNTLNNVYLTLEELNIFMSVMSSKVPHIKAVMYDGRFYTNTDKLPYQVCECCKIKNSKKPIVIKNGERLTAVMKSYLKEQNFDNVTLITSISNADISDIVNKCRGYSSNRPIAIDAIINSVVKCFKNLHTIDFNTDKGFLDYKAEVAAQAKELKASLKVKEFLIHCYDDNYSWLYKVTRRFNSLDDVKKYIKTLNRGVVVNTVGETTEEMIKMAKERGYYYITCNKEITKVLKDLNMSCIVSPQFLYKDDPQLSKIYTLGKYRKFGLNNLTDINILVPEANQEEVTILRKLIEYSVNRPSFRMFADSTDKEDAYIKHLCLKYNAYHSIISNAMIELNLDEVGSAIKNLLLREYIRKNRLFRMNNSVYKDLNNSNIIRLVCRK